MLHLFLWFGMEVSFPRTPDKNRGMAHVDGVLVDALRVAWHSPVAPHFLLSAQL
jgi:hypothetical protein